MARELLTYLDYAENDYKFFRESYDRDVKGSPLASIGQNICERYLKHIIDEYAEPESDQEILWKESVLRTHSLHRLMKYLLEEMQLEVPEDVEEALDRIDGFYFSTRYPGADSFIPTSRDIDKANTAVEKARNFTLSICHELDGHDIEESVDEHQNIENDVQQMTFHDIGDDIDL